MPSLAPTRILNSEDYSVPGLVLSTGSRLVRIVEVPPTSANCYVMVESIDTGERYPLTIALLRELLRRHPVEIAMR